MHIVLPVQRFTRAKSRLSSVWSEDQRAYAARWMFERVLTALRGATHDAHHITVLSDDAEVRSVAESHGAQTVADDPALGGHGAQLAAFAEGIRASDPLLVLMGDLPLITASAVEALLIACTRTDVLLAPDRHMMGTNAAYFLNRYHRHLHFGHADSFVRHRRACAIDARVAIHKAPAFRYDLDSSEDLRALQDWQRVYAPDDEELARCLWGSHA